MVVAVTGTPGAPVVAAAATVTVGAVPAAEAVVGVNLDRFWVAWVAFSGFMELVTPAAEVGKVGAISGTDAVGCWARGGVGAAIDDDFRLCEERAEAEASGAVAVTLEASRGAAERG